MNLSRYHFRPVEEWKTAIMNLPYFFDLAQSIFGNIKTPYNKQRLMDDLFTFLSRDDIRKTISSYIDADDRKIIAAVALLDDPLPIELEDFFLGEKNPVVLKGFLLNLEERLILFRFIDDKDMQRYALNPVLEPVLAPLASQKEILFFHEAAETEAADANEKPANIPVIDDRILGALIAFTLGEEDFLRGDEIRKKVNARAKKFFPGLDLETAAGVLILLGLFYSDGDKLLPTNRRIQRFAALSPLERRMYWAAGIYLLLNEKSGNNPDKQKNTGTLNFSFSNLDFSKSRIQYHANQFYKFYSFLDCMRPDVKHDVGETNTLPKQPYPDRSAAGLVDSGRQYPEITFLRILRLFEKEISNNYWGMGEKTEPRIFFRALETAGIIGKSSKDNFWIFSPVQKSEKSGPVIAFDSPSSMILYPGISFEEIIKLASFSNVREDSLFNFEIIKASVVRGFDLGLSAGDMINTLKNISGGRIDEGLEWTLKDWENQYGDVSLFDGLILFLSEERRYLAETKTVASLINKTLAPGIYLLSSDKSDAAAVLQKAGVEIIGRPSPEKSESSGRNKGAGISASSFDSYYNAYPSLKSYSTAGFANENLVINKYSGVETDDSQNEIKKELKEHLSKLSISKEQKDELRYRIERRVILWKPQLDKAVIKFRKLEAKGLDYAGKTSIAKQAIAEGAELEVHWPGPEGSRTIYGTPLALDKKEGENVLVLKPAHEPSVKENPEVSADTVRIPLGKISLLRMIKQSIF